MSEDGKQSPLRRLVWGFLDRKAARIQDADIHADPVRWSENEIRVFDYVARMVRFISWFTIALLATSGMGLLWTAIEAFWTRTYWLLGYGLLMGAASLAMSVKFFQDHRKTVAELSGQRAEMVATFNEFKERNGWNDATP